MELVGIGLGDQIADQPVIADPFVPFDLRVRRQGRLGDPGHDRRLGHQMLAGRLAPSDRAVDAAERVLHRHGLRPRGLHVLLRPPAAGQEVCNLAVDEMAAVELGRDLHREAHVRPRLLHFLPFGNCADEIAAETDEALDLARQEALAGLHGVHSLLARRIEAEELGDLVERRELGLLGDADRALALDVRMASDRRDSRAFATDVALEQQEVDKHLDGLDPVYMLGEAHAVVADHAFGLDIALRRLFDPCHERPDCVSIACHDPARTFGLEFLKTARLLFDEFAVQYAIPVSLRGVIRFDGGFAKPDNAADVPAGAT